MDDQCCDSFRVQPFRRKYLNEYFERYSQDNLNCLWDDHIASVLEEQGFFAKDSPRSVYKVEKLYEALDKFKPSNTPHVDLSDPDVAAGVRLAWKCFAKPKGVEYLELKPFTPKLVYQITKNHTGSAGLTAWGQTKAESYVRAYDRGLQVIKGEKAPDPCVAFKRTQFNDKTRLVWGYPYAMTALEGIFSRPLIEQYKKGGTPMAFALPDGVLGTKIRVSHYHSKYAYSIDISQFDASQAPELIELSYKINSTWFDLDQIEPTSGVSYREIMRINKNYCIHTPIVMPDGNLYLGKQHGIPSGSYDTQGHDSKHNTVAVGAISHHFHLDVDRREIFILGDDMLFFSNRKVKLDDIAKFLANKFHWKMNVEKSAIFKFGESIHFLGRIWDNGFPDQELDEILIRMTQPEKFRKYSKTEEDRRREVRLMIMSYASVYREANRIWALTESDRGRWFKTPNVYEQDVLGNRGSPKQEERLEMYAKEMFSGLQRYKFKYVYDDVISHRPLALQYWN